MELNTEIPTAPPRDAATVVRLRDTAQGPEVVLVKPHRPADVLGGARLRAAARLAGDAR